MDEKQLVEFSNVHLGREIYTLFGAVELLATHQVDPKDLLSLCARSIFLESVILHSRCLIEFFYGEQLSVSRRNSDIRAKDFFDDPSVWNQLRPRMPDHFIEFHRRASKELMHLTLARTDTAESAASWNVYLVTRDLLVALQLFIGAADVRKLDRKLVSDLESVRGRIMPILQQSLSNQIFRASPLGV